MFNMNKRLLGKIVRVLAKTATRAYFGCDAYLDLPHYLKKVYDALMYVISQNLSPVIVARVVSKVAIKEFLKKSEIDEKKANLASLEVYNKLKELIHLTNEQGL